MCMKQQLSEIMQQLIQKSVPYGALLFEISMRG